VTREEAAKLAEVFTALSEGKTIQFRSSYEENATWLDLDSDSDIDLSLFEHRVKPETVEFWLNEYPSTANLTAYGLYRHADRYFHAVLCDSKSAAQANTLPRCIGQVKFREVTDE